MGPSVGPAQPGRGRRVELKAYLQGVGYRLAALALGVVAVAGWAGLAVAQRPALGLVLAGALLAMAGLAELESREARRRARASYPGRWASSSSR